MDNHRSSCGFATFDQCDPLTCELNCFTHRVHVINLDMERDMHAEARLRGWLVAAILAIGAAGLLVGAMAMQQVETAYQMERV